MNVLMNFRFISRRGALHLQNALHFGVKSVLVSQL